MWDSLGVEIVLVAAADWSDRWPPFYYQWREVVYVRRASEACFGELISSSGVRWQVGGDAKKRPVSVRAPRGLEWQEML